MSSIEVGVPGTTRLFQAWLQKSLLDDTPTDLALTNTPSVFNNSTFGIRAHWAIAPTLYVMAAVLDGIPNDPARPKRTAIRFAKSGGSFSIGELSWLPEADNDKFNGHRRPHQHRAVSRQ